MPWTYTYLVVSVLTIQASMQYDIVVVLLIVILFLLFFLLLLHLLLLVPSTLSRLYRLPRNKVYSLTPPSQISATLVVLSASLL